MTPTGIGQPVAAIDELAASAAAWRRKFGASVVDDENASRVAGRRRDGRLRVHGQAHRPAPARIRTHGPDNHRASRPAEPVRSARRRRAPLRFDDERALAETLRGAHTLYNTYWVRFPHGETTYERAVANTLTLLRAACRARIRRLVHVSIVHASEDSELPYFRAKGIVEQEIRASRLSYGIVRPTVLFGGGDVLINNIAWVVRRFPVFAVPGSGDYRIRPVHVGDVARLCVDAAARDEPVTLDACGPESFGYAELVRMIARAVGRRLRLVHVSPRLALRLASVIGGRVGDVLLTPDELAGLMQGLLTSDGPPTGRTSFARWLEDHCARLGLTYASELDRHYR